MNRRSNFIFSNDKTHLYSETTHAKDFESKKISTNQKSETQEHVAKLRKTNFNLGFEKVNYETTAQSNVFQGNEKPGLDKTAALTRKSKMTGHSIVYGFNRPGYQTTNNQNYIQMDVTGNSEQQRLTKERGQNLKKANFNFGHDGIGKQINQSHGCSPVLSPAQSAGATIGGQAAKEMSKQVRKSHFEMGKDPNNYESMA